MRRMIPQNKIEVLDKFNIDHIYDDAVVVDGSIYMSSRLGEGDPLISTNDGILQISADATKVVGDTGNAAVVLNGGEVPYVDIMADGETIAELSRNTITINTYEEENVRSLSINTHGIQSPVDEYSLCFGLDFDGEQGGVLWTDEPGAGLVVAPNGNVQLYGGTSIKIVGLPTSDPHVKNQLWNDNGVLKISSGN